MSKETSTGNDTNTMGVQELIDRLKTDGVTKGQAEAELLVTEARKQAMVILDDAKKEAESLLKKARDETRLLEDHGKQALTLASRDSVLQLREAFRDEFQRRFGKLVSFTLQDTEFLKKLILEIANGSTSHGDSQRVEILLPMVDGRAAELSGGLDAAEEGSLSHFVLGLTGDLLREGVSFSVNDRSEHGVRVRLVDRDVEVDLTDETVTGLLMRFLTPKFRELIDSRN